MTISEMLHNKPPMTKRAKAYLWIGCFRTIPIVIACFFGSSTFQSPAWDYIRGVMPMWTWGIALGISAATCAAAAITQQEWLARTALIGSASLAMCWVIGFMVAYQQGVVISPVGIMWGAGIAAKDLVVCRQPLWSPFEPLVQRVTRPERRHVEAA